MGSLKGIIQHIPLNSGVRVKTREMYDNNTRGQSKIIPDLAIGKRSQDFTLTPTIIYTATDEQQPLS